MPITLPRWNSDDVEKLRPFSDVKLIVLDIDGTLLEKEKEGVFRAVNELQKSLAHYGVKITLATGRTLFSVYPFLEKLGIKNDIPIILYNGSLVTTNGNWRILLNRTIPKQSIRDIASILDKWKVSLLIYVCKMTFAVTGPVEDVICISYNGSTTIEPNGMSVKLVEKEYLEKIPNPTAVLIDFSNEDANLNSIYAELNSIKDISITTSGGKYIEIRPGATDKSTALECILHDLKIIKKEVAAVGDNDNDAEMLKSVGLGISVSNASENALNNSKYVCNLGPESGVIEVLRLIKQAKRFFVEKTIGE